MFRNLLSLLTLGLAWKTRKDIKKLQDSLRTRVDPSPPSIAVRQDEGLMNGESLPAYHPPPPVKPVVPKFDYARYIPAPKLDPQAEIQKAVLAEDYEKAAQLQAAQQPTLAAQLEAAIKAEDYDRAAQLRDQLRNTQK